MKKKISNSIRKHKKLLSIFFLTSSYFLGIFCFQVGKTYGEDMGFEENRARRPKKIDPEASLKRNIIENYLKMIQQTHQELSESEFQTVSQVSDERGRVVSPLAIRLPTADLAVSLTGPSSGKVGDDFSYQVELVNDGPFPISGTSIIWEIHCDGENSINSFRSYLSVSPLVMTEFNLFQSCNPPSQYPANYSIKVSAEVPASITDPNEENNKATLNVTVYVPRPLTRTAPLFR